MVLLPLRVPLVPARREEDLHIVDVHHRLVVAPAVGGEGPTAVAVGAGGFGLKKNTDVRNELAHCPGEVDELCE